MILGMEKCSTRPGIVHESLRWILVAAVCWPPRPVDPARPAVCRGRLPHEVSPQVRKLQRKPEVDASGTVTRRVRCKFISICWPFCCLLTSTLRLMVLLRTFHLASYEYSAAPAQGFVRCPAQQTIERPLTLRNAESRSASARCMHAAALARTVI